MAVIENPPSDLVTVSSHRGLHALIDGANPLVPENSLQAIGLAAQAGLEMIELDIKLTSDGVPVMSHDQTWGREACPTQGFIGTFNPFIAQGSNSENDSLNYPVNSMTLIATGSSLFLRDTVSVIKENGSTSSCEADYQDGAPHIYPSTLQGVLNFLTQNKIAMVLALDLRDGPAAEAAWKVIAATSDFLGNSYAQSTLFKIPGKAFLNPNNPGVFTDTTVFANTFPSVNFVSPNGGATTALDYSDVHLQPVYNTGDIAKNLYGNESNIITQLKAFETNPFINVIAVEVQFKQPGGILSAVVSAARQNWATGGLESVSVFSPYVDYTYPSDATQTPLFFTTSGYCCVPLAAFYYGPTMANPNGPNSPNPAIPYPAVPNPNYTAGQPTDTADERGNLSFVISQGYNSVTRDDAAQFVKLVAAAGDRNISYMRTGGPDPNCQPGIGQFPGCEADSLTTYVLCANSGGRCTFYGDRNIAYGANGIYKTLTFSNTVACIAGSFPGATPSAGNSCYMSPPISYVPPVNTGGGGSALQGYPVYCADEGQICNFDGLQNFWAFGVTPYWAANHKYSSSRFAIRGGSSYQCAQSTFTADPALNITKACFYLAGQQYAFAHDAPPGYGFCGGMRGTCPVQGTARIKYGRAGMFTTRVVNGPTACDDSTFGDPAPGYTKDCWVEATIAASGAPGIQVGPSANGTTSTCDIYASGGTPCVAAHSMVRALFTAYSGKLYQVKRASDGTTSDIGTLTTGGYANAVGQDAFCAGTTCTITLIYDQSPQKNDLAIEGPGGAAPHADAGAVANALPVVVNGNAVYGLKVTPGVGYRNNATSGVARNVANNKIAAPEGMYMVTSGTYVNGGCCFDYGNAETSGNDTGNGHMDALNFGTFCEYTCSGSGPWVEADLENGQYQGNGTNTNDQSLSSNFVTAMLKNDSQTTFALKGGNAQSGGLTTEYSGSLPTKGGYTPMSLEGAIVLGTGGDNSNASLGSFFEGAITSGYPTDATESAVQANIVAAGYAGDSSGGGGTGGTSVIEPSGPYTGPSDPGGPGPQDGFGTPAIQQPNDVMATKPALTSFNGSLYVAFEGVNVNNDLYVTSSATGTNFPVATQYKNIQMSSAPAMATYNNQVFVAFRGLNVNNDFYITSSLTGTNFPAATQYTNIQMGGAPALAVFNDQLYAAFQANDAGHTLHITASSDGVNWPTAWQIPNVKIGSDPAMAVLNGVLYIAFRADDPGNDVWIASSSDGISFTSQKLLPQTTDGYSSPALVASNGILYYIYEANDKGHEMMVTTSTDGSTWQGPAAYLGIQMGAAGPGAAAFGNGVSVGFQSNDSRNVLYVTGKATEAATYTGPTDSGNGGAQDTFTATAAQQSNIIMGTKPALAAFNGNLYAAFGGVGVNNDLYVASSSIHLYFPSATQYTNIRMSSAPALAAFNNKLYVAFRGLSVNNDLYITSSSTGTNFPSAAQQTNIQMGGAPAMALFNNQLYVAFQANDASHTLHVTRSTDGVTWPTAYPISNIQIGSDPAMASYNGLLYIAFRANDSSNDVWIASSSDGVNFSSYKLAGQTMAAGSSPALAVVTQNDSNYLYYVYEANDVSHEMLVSTTTDGSNWKSPAVYSNINVGATGPAAAGFANTAYVGFQSNDARNVLFVASQPVSDQGGPKGGIYLAASTYYPRMVRLSHGPAATNGNVVISTDGNITVSTPSFLLFTGTVPSQYGYHLGSGTLYELPQTVGSLQAGTLLYAATYYYGSGHNTAIEVNISTDGGYTWHYSSMPASGAGYAGDGFWEPQFTVANDGALVMFWSDETDSCCSQKLSQIRTYNGTTWQDKTNTVGSPIQGDRPGMSVVTKLPSGIYFMSYELCGPAACTVFYRTSTDGWNYGSPGNTGTKVQTASGQYFEHAPTNAWSPSPLGINGALLLMGQQMFDNNGAVDPNGGSQMFVNLSSDGSGPWYTIAAPVSVPNPPDNYCPNYSTALLPATDGSVIFEVTSAYNNNNQCVSFYGSESWNKLPADKSAFVLSNAHAGLYLTTGADKQPAVLEPSANGTVSGPQQVWQALSQGRGWFKLQNVGSGLCLDNVGGSSTPKNPVDVWDCAANDTNQNWQFMDLANGQYKLLNQAGQLPLDDTGGSKAPGTALSIWLDNSLDSQHWVISQ